MKKLIKPLGVILLVLLTLLSVFFISFSFYLSNELVAAEKDLSDKQSEFTKLQQNPPREPLLDYVFGLNKYDSKGANPISYQCYEPEKRQNMSPKDEYWYNAAEHYPPYPSDNPQINIILDVFERNNKLRPSEICKSPIANDYLVVAETADMYRFDKDLTYKVYSVSTRFDWFTIVSWLDNGDVIYSPGGSNSVITYVFTAKNEDILLEYCENKPLKDKDDNFVCKNFNTISSNSTYVSWEDLYKYLMPSHW